MEFALVDGQRHSAKPSLIGACQVCDERMSPKCGTKISWHWAHSARRHCDPWWENETQWHRSWKARFPESWREQVHFDTTGEKHIADVKTPAGVVLEFQNSPMPSEELRARERFYGNMLWILNGAPFAARFFVLGRLPSPEANWARDIVFDPQARNRDGRGFWRPSENPGHKAGGLVRAHSLREIQSEIDRDYVGHHLYDWVRPHSVWFESNASVYVDFGGDLLWHLQPYRYHPAYGEGLRAVQAVRKSTVAARHGGVYVDTGETFRGARTPIRNGGVDHSGQDEVLLHAVK